VTVKGSEKPEMLQVEGTRTVITTLTVFFMVSALEVGMAITATKMTKQTMPALLRDAKKKPTARRRRYTYENPKRAARESLSLLP